MPRTVLPGRQVEDASIGRSDLHIETAAEAVIRKLVAGFGVVLSSTGAAEGTGDVTIRHLLPITTRAANVTITDADHTVYCDATAGAFTVTLPSAVGRAGKDFIIKKIDASLNGVSLAPPGGETIDGLTGVRRLALQHQGLMVRSTGTAWAVAGVI